MRRIFFDIETAAGDGALEDAAIAYAARRGEDIGRADFKIRAPLSAIHGRVTAIGWAIDDGEPVAAVDLNSERKVLATFAQALGGEPFVLIGHNINRFDIPFLQVRAMVHGSQSMPSLLGGFGGKPWERRTIDTCDIMPSSGGMPGDKSLVIACRALGVDVDAGDESGDAMDGAAARGDVDAIRRHVIADVQRVRNLYRRLAPFIKAG